MLPLILSRELSCTWRFRLAFGRWLTMCADGCWVAWNELRLSFESNDLDWLPVGVETGDSARLGAGSGGGDVLLFRCCVKLCCHRKRPSASFPRTLNYNKNNKNIYDELKFNDHAERTVLMDGWMAAAVFNIPKISFIEFPLNNIHSNSHLDCILFNIKTESIHFKVSPISIFIQISHWSN